MTSFNYQTSNYLAPGVSVTEDVNQNVAPLIATANDICLVGPTSGSIQVTETIKLTGTNATKLSLAPTDSVMYDGSLPGTVSSVLSIKAVDTAKAQKENPNSVLTGNISETETNIIVKDASHFPTSGTIFIGNEKITYSGINPTTNTLINAVRGVDGTTAATHSASAAVNTYSINDGFSDAAYTFVPGTGEGTHTIARNTVSETQTVTLLNPSAGTFTITFTPAVGTPLTTAALAYNATADQVATALTNLTAIGSGDVTVTKDTAGANSIYTISFSGDSVAYNVAELTVNADNLVAGDHEQQTVTLENSNDGYFVLSYGATDTDPIAYDSAASVVATQLNTAINDELSTSNITYVSVTKTNANVYIVEFIGGDFGLGTENPDSLTADANNLKIWVDTTVQGTTGTDEQQTITLNENVTGGTFTLTFDGDTTTNIAYNASAATVQTALNALASIDVDGVGVTKTSGIWTVTFSGDNLDETNQPSITANGDNLTGTNLPAITIDTTQEINTTKSEIETTVSGNPEVAGVAQIPDNSYVYITYTYVPKDFWNAQRFDNMADVEAKFGTKFNANRTAVNSPLSMAAQIAFENGATSVIVQPLFYEDAVTNVRTEPTNQQVSDITNTWEPTLAALRDLEGIGTIVPIIGQASSISICQGDSIVNSSVTQVGTTVTRSSGDAFTVDLEGKTLVYTDTGITATITGFTDSNTVTVNRSLSQATPADCKILISEINDETMNQIFHAFQRHIDYQQQYNDQYIIAILGEDGTDTLIPDYASRTTIRNHAVSLQSSYPDQTGISRYAENLVFISVPKLKRPLPNGTQKLNLGGQYAAAAVSGMIASRRVSATLTRKNLVGFSDITDVISKQNKTDDSSRGLFVLEQKGAAIQVRHAVTLNVNSVDKSELSVVRAKHKVINSLRLTVDTQIIGQVVADNNAPLIVGSAIGGTLATLVDDGDIVGFSDVQAKTYNLNPTIIEVRFAYRPAFPVNYINIHFAIDLTSGGLTLGDTTTQINSGALNG